jgi:oxalate---CoA ligase
MNSTVLYLPNEESKTPAVIIPSAANGRAPSISSYRDISSSVKSVRQVLSNIGVGKGSKVIFALPNGLEIVIAFLSVVGQRAIAAPLNPQLKESEYSDTFKLIEPSLLIVAGSGSDVAAVSAARALGIPVGRCTRTMEAVELKVGSMAITKTHSPVTQDETRPDDVALMLYTSGTTGRPKAVPLTHENILVSMRIIIQAHKLSSTDRCLLITPLFHVAGLCASLLCTLFSGGCAIIPPSLPGNFWQHFSDYQATWFHGVPTLHRLLLSFPRPEKMPKVRFIRSGGSDLDAITFERLEKEFDAPVLEIYGMTETAPGIFCNKFNSSRRLGYYPIPDSVEVRILAGNLLAQKDEVGIVGEICVWGRSIMSGYINNPAANRDAFVDGFFRTGDLGAIHEGGYLQLTGRIKDIINKGGEKISPSEIENIVQSHELVRQAVCFKVPDDIYGEDIGKFQLAFESLTADTSC